MTKIPRLELVAEIKAKITNTLIGHDYLSDWVNTGIDGIVESFQADLTVEREAGAREERESYIIKLKDIVSADAFVGFSPEEFRGVKKLALLEIRRKLGK